MNYSIGIDLGATKILSGIIDEKADILFSIKKDTDKRGGQFLLKQIEDIINILIEKSFELNINISAVGIGSPGRIDTKNGIVKDCTPNLKDWKNINLKEGININLPVFIDNDANVSAYGEYIYSNINKDSTIVVLTLGTGLGCGVIYNDRVFRGKGLSPEIGHIIIEKNGRTCNCGQIGCLERYVSGNAIEDRARELLFKYPDSKLNNGISSHNIFNFANENDTLSIILIDEFIDYLSTGIISIINVLDPSEIILSGGISDNIEKYLKNIRDRVKSQINVSEFNPEIIKIANLKSNAGLIGAGLIAFLGNKTGEI